MPILPFHFGAKKTTQPAKTAEQPQVSRPLNQALTVDDCSARVEKSLPSGTVKSVTVSGNCPGIQFNTTGSNDAYTIDQAFSFGPRSTPYLPFFSVGCRPEDQATDSGFLKIQAGHREVTIQISKGEHGFQVLERLAKEMNQEFKSGSFPFGTNDKSAQIIDCPGNSSLSRYSISFGPMNPPRAADVFKK